jgi:hypothetical protein
LAFSKVRGSWLGVEITCILDDTGEVEMRLRWAALFYQGCKTIGCIQGAGMIKNGREIKGCGIE